MMALSIGTYDSGIGRSRAPAEPVGVAFGSAGASPLPEFGLLLVLMSRVWIDCSARLVLDGDLQLLGAR